MSTESLTDRPIALPGRLAVPWMTVLPLAALMAYADGFWMVSVRGAVGAIERTQEPFSSWWRESTLTLPLFVFAVLAASMLAMRLFGPVLNTVKAVLSTALLLAVAGTLAGLAVIAFNTWVDYSLETDLLRMMDVMHGGCVGNCVALQEQSTFAALTRAVLYSGLFALVTNLVLVGWVVAMRGGRLAVATVRPPSAATGRAAHTRIDQARLLLVAALIGSAVIHAAVVPEHLAEWTAAGVFFILLTVVQVGVAVLLVSRPDRVLLWLAVALNAGPLLLWMYSRTVGLPFGPEPGVAESVGTADVMAGMLELLALTAAIVLLRANPSARRRPAAAHSRSLILVAVLGVTMIGLAGAVPSLVNGIDVGSHAQDSAEEPQADE